MERIGGQALQVVVRLQPDTLIVARWRAAAPTATPTVESTHDVTYFVTHQLAVIRQAIDDLSTYLKRKTREVRETEQLLRATDDLNHRQIALVGRALRHPADDVTIESHRRSHGSAYDTARKDLLDLAARGWFTQHKRANAFVFRPVPDLAKRASGKPGR